MSIKSREFGGVTLTGEDAAAFRRQFDPSPADDPMQDDEEDIVVTPTDALIEKMARAHYEWGRLRGWAATPWDQMRQHHRERYVEQMRAAYEAEHEETKG